MRSVLVACALTACAFEHGRVAIDAPRAAPRDCLDALQQRVATSDGVVTIDPDGEGVGNVPFSAYCDMTTAGGGWTLVYAYGFTNYASFDNGQNAATPRPDWPLTATETTLVPISTQVPVSPTTSGALSFSRWTELGNNVLVTSNINHWLRCSPAGAGGGDLVARSAGNVTCTIEKLVATACTTQVPTYLAWYDRGPTLLATSSGSPHYYYWEASTSGSWPTHDPCGANATNQLTNVTNPGGAILLRR